MKNIIDFLEENRLCFDYEENYDLSNKNGLKINISARVFIWVKDDLFLSKLFYLLNKERVPHAFWGGGFNTICFDTIYHGVIISLSNTFNYVVLEPDGLVHIGGATKNNEAISKAHRLSKMGLECLHMVPGTIGGSLVGNAGMKEETINKYLKYIVIDDGFGSRKIYKEDIYFEYRGSNIKNIILKAVFELPEYDNSAQEKMRKIKIQKESQPYGEPSVGCIFKNPRPFKHTAAELIEKCDLKGSGICVFKISEDHANFIINTDKDKNSHPIYLHDLINKIISKVSSHTGQHLELEVKVLSDEKRP